MNLASIKNWKLKELKDYIEIIAIDSVNERDSILERLKLPLSEYLTGMNRSETLIDWRKMNDSHRFYFDYENSEKEIIKWLNKSKISKSKKVIITYGWNEPMIKISTKLFIQEWEDLFQSVKYETIIFSEDYNQIIEVSRDYYLHSNFKICDNQILR